MKFAPTLNLALLCLTSAFSLPVFAQGLQVDVEELKRLAGEVADLKEANQSQQRRIRELASQVESLRSSLRSSEERFSTKLGDFISREELKKVVESIRDVDEKRDADKKLILDQISELGKKLTLPPPDTTSTHKGSRKESKQKESRQESSAPIEGDFYEYKVQKNDFFSKIVSDWNATLKEKGRKTISSDDVKRANPGLNVDKIYDGQKILLPFPPEKK